MAFKLKDGSGVEHTYDQTKLKIPSTTEGETVVFTQGEAQAEKTVYIDFNGAFVVEPDAGYAFVKRVSGTVDVPVEPYIPITELSTTEPVSALSYGSFVPSVFAKNGGSATKQFMSSGFEKIIFSVDVDGLVPNIPVEYNVDEAATLLFNMDKPKTTSVVFRGAPGQILVNVNESTNLAIDITPEIITTITQQTIAYIRTALGSDTIGVTCHDYIHVNMMNGG